MKRLMLWILVASLITLTNSWTAFAKVEYNDQLGLVTMSVADLRTYEKIAESERIYFDALEEAELKIQEKQEARERERLIALGLGIALGWLIAK
jgi:hypothetical protein